jgi:hypothetical protein
MHGEDGNFVESAVEHQRERFEGRYRLQAQCHDFEKILDRVGKPIGVRRGEILGPRKKPERVLVISLVCYCAVQEKK